MRTLTFQLLESYQKKKNTILHRQDLTMNYTRDTLPRALYGVSKPLLTG
jgi:hypothetical protein